MHTPVLLQEVLAGFQVRPCGHYIDATFGEGGHTKGLLERGARVLAIDRDVHQVESHKVESMEKNLVLRQGNFKDIEEIAKKEQFAPVDGVLFDLGLSYEQISGGNLGLSYKNMQEILDMRLDNEATRSASEILHTATEKELITIFMRNAEEIHAGAIAKRIVEERVGMRTFTVGWLVSVIKQVVRDQQNSAITRVFQALRVEVNNEFENLKKGLVGATHILAPNGKIAVISFHSLEDRIVKLFIKEHGYVQMSKKPIFGNDELRFERSAVLRIFSL